MYSQILLPLDGSKLSEKALPHAQGLARPAGAKVHLIYVFTSHPSGGTPLGGGIEANQSVSQTAEIARQLQEAQINETQEYLEHVAKTLNDDGIETQIEIHEGAPHDHIVDYARQHGIDLIIMASHGHGGLKRLLTGSTTDKVVRAGEVPVLVVPCI